MLKILGIAGSLRKESFNKKLLNAAVKLCPSEATIEVADWSELPMFNQDQETNFPPPAMAFKEQVRSADAILLVTPEYNYSIPGPLKNAIDWASRPYGDSAWQRKPIALMGASIGMLGTVRAQLALRQSLVFFDAHVVSTPEVYVGNAQDKFDAEGNFTDDHGIQNVTKLLEALIALTRQMKK